MEEKSPVEKEKKKSTAPPPAKDLDWQTSVKNPEKAVTKNVEIDEAKESQGTPALVSAVTEGNVPKADIETAKALIAEKEQMIAVIEEYDQKMEQIKNPPFSKEAAK